jgi:hypothetical protein
MSRRVWPICQMNIVCDTRVSGGRWEQEGLLRRQEVITASRTILTFPGIRGEISFDAGAASKAVRDNRNSPSSVVITVIRPIQEGRSVTSQLCGPERDIALRCAISHLRTLHAVPR